MSRLLRSAVFLVGTCLLPVLVWATPAIDEAKALLPDKAHKAVVLLQAISAEKLSPKSAISRVRYLCEGLSLLGEYSEALDVSAAVLPESSGDQVRWLQCRGKAAEYLGQNDVALAALEQAVAQAQGLQDRALEGAVLMQLGDVYIQHGRHDEALGVLTEAYAAANAVGDTTIRLNALNSLANVYYNTGQLEPAQRYYLELAELDEQRGDEQALATTLFNLGHVYATQQDFAQADASFAKSLGLSRSLKDESGEAYTLKAMGVSAQAQSQLDTAKQRLLEARHLFKQLGDERQQASVNRHLGDIALETQAHEAAIDYYQAALPYLQKHMFQKALLRTYRGLAQAYGEVADFERAYLAQQAYTLLMQDDLERQNRETTQRLQVMFDTQRFADENTRLALQNEKQELELSHRQQRLQLQYLALGLAAVVVALFVVLWQRTRRHAAHMQELATIDALTQLLNRRAIYDLGAQEWQRAVRFERPMTVLLFDIDHFKSINDTFGHGVGDEVLTAVAGVGKAAMRQTDAMGRIGGEEFLVICSETDQTQARILAERIRENIEATRYESMPDRIVTVSIGVAQYRGEESLDVLVNKADEALYEAKEGGRNRVVMA